LTLLGNNMNPNTISQNTDLQFSLMEPNYNISEYNPDYPENPYINELEKTKPTNEDNYEIYSQMNGSTLPSDSPVRTNIERVFPLAHHQNI